MSSIKVSYLEIITYSFSSNSHPKYEPNNLQSVTNSFTATLTYCFYSFPNLTGFARLWVLFVRFNELEALINRLPAPLAAPPPSSALPLVLQSLKTPLIQLLHPPHW